MPRNSLVATRHERNQALIDAMILAASADGSLAGIEMRTLVARVLERPEFEGTSAEELNTAIELSAKRLAGAAKLSDVLESLQKRLPDHHNRLLAFGLAKSMALADHKTTPDEIGLLKTLQKTLGVSEDEVSRIFETVERGASLSEALGEPAERLFAEVMVYVAAADGEVNQAELEQMLETMAGDAAFKNVSLRGAETHLKAAMQTLATEGIANRLTVLARGLATHAQRLKAFQLAFRVAWASKKPSKQALHVLELLQATFGLADDEVARLSLEN